MTLFCLFSVVMTITDQMTATGMKTLLFNAEKRKSVEKAIFISPS